MLYSDLNIFGGIISLESRYTVIYCPHSLCLALQNINMMEVNFFF